MAAPHKEPNLLPLATGPAPADATQSATPARHEPRGAVQGRGVVPSIVRLYSSRSQDHSALATLQTVTGGDLQVSALGQDHSPSF